jgi:hypothetical protein
MSTKRIQFFMQSGEFDQLVYTWRKREGLHVLVPIESQVIECHDSQLYYVHKELFLTERIPDSMDWDTSRAPGQLGWIEVTPPIVQGNALLKAEIASKSDWYDSETETQRKNDDVHVLFRTVAKHLRKHLRYPVWGKNVAYHTPWEACQDIGYSQGAADWVASGGELRQEGVRNILFSVSPDPHSKEQ